MSFFEELNEEEPLFRSDLIAGGHPLKTENEERRQEYLNLVALISQADGESHPSETAMVRDLGGALDIPAPRVEDAASALARSAKTDVEEALARWRGHAHAYILFVDVCRVASSDSVLKRKEAELLKWISTRLGLSSEQHDALQDFAKWLRVPGSRDGESVRARLLQAGVPIETLQFLFDEQRRAIEALDNRRAEDDASASGGHPNSLPVQAIHSAQNAILGHLNGLVKHVNSCRPTGDGAYALGTAEQLDAYLNRIDEEKQKVEYLRMTLAVIGPMKAGKSTVINAIIGDEILPTRSGAMTTLPTLITHTAGRHEAVLRFKKSQPFNDLLDGIRGKLAEFDSECESGSFGEHADFAPTLNRIRSGKLSKFAEVYEGRSRIHALLHDLNDIVRISQDESIQLENPLTQYQRIEDFPEIEVEFTYLQGRLGESVGRLSLVDTPGPNEAGQGHLKGVVKEQLRASTAVLVVVSPGEFDSEAFHEINLWLREARTEHGTPLYIFCNKYDTMSASERKSNWIEQKCLTRFPDVKMANGETHSVAGRVFGVSAKWGLLANRVLRALERDGGLPEHQFIENSWVEDFASQAYGTSQTTLDALRTRDQTEHGKASQRMWQDSLMARPLQEVVAASLHRAAPICLEHAASEVIRIGDELQKKAHGTRIGLDRELRELQRTLDNMQKRLQDLHKVHEDLKPLCGKALGDIKRKLKETLKNLEQQVSGTLRKLSKAEQERMQKEDQEQANQRPAPYSFLDLLGKRRSKSVVQQVLTEDDPIRFSTNNDANEFMESVQREIKKATDSMLQSAAVDLEPTVADVQKRLAEELKKRVSPLMDSFREEFKKDFDVDLEPPSPQLPKLKLDLDILIAGQIRSETVTKTRHERRWYTLWLCQHEVKYQDIEFRIEPKKVRDSIQKAMTEEFKYCEEAILGYVQGEFEERMRAHFEGLGKQMDLAKDVAEGAIAAKQESQQKQEATKRDLSEKSREFEEFSRAVKLTASALLQATGGGA